VTVPDKTFRAFAQDPLLGGLRHGHTTGGHAVACAAALTVLDIIAADGLIEHAATMGRLLATALEPARDIPGVRDVRGRGLLLGVELETDERASDVAAAAQDGGVLVRPFGSVLTIAPPLVITTEEAERGASVVLEACATAAARNQVPR
jgi:adenosylmethionine-8-amino-7-oxononanoate aminotransferase